MASSTPGSSPMDPSFSPRRAPALQDRPSAVRPRRLSQHRRCRQPRRLIHLTDDSTSRSPQWMQEHELPPPRCTHRPSESPRSPPR
uniref:Uncharacterized protein n=1 Tax=Triticum urartu TaxID=4572 RepID=A0A8R7QBK0_TRIUA